MIKNDKLVQKISVRDGAAERDTLKLIVPN